MVGYLDGDGLVWATPGLPPGPEDSTTSAIGAIGRPRILVGHRGGRDSAPAVADSIACAELAGDRPPARAIAR